MHNGRIVTDHHPDYLVIPSINDDNTMVSSDLRIFSVSVAWSGKVTCIASTNSPEGSGVTLTNHTANTSLTVLGKYVNGCTMHKISIYVNIIHIN